MTAHAEAPREGNSMIYLALVPAGLAIGAGAVLFYYSVGWENGPLNQDLAAAGFTGLDNLGALWGMDFAPGLIVLGLVTMVILNANAWKITGGY